MLTEPNLHYTQADVDALLKRATELVTEVEQLRAEVERMRPVVEAAQAWRALLAGPPEPYHRAEVRDLVGAVDALDAAEPTPQAVTQ
jgi:hypothetical protein